MSLKFLQYVSIKYISNIRIRKVIKIPKNGRILLFGNYNSVANIKIKKNQPWTSTS